MAINLDKVAQYDFVVVVDASGSMDTKDVKSGFFGSITRWEAIQKTAIKFSEDIEKIDTDGIGFVLFSGYDVKSYPNASSKDVAAAFKQNNPGGSTPLAEALTAAINLLKGSPKKKFIMVFTDGVPDNKASAAKVIVDQANSQVTDDELTILFIQIGADSSATAYLSTLDNDLKGAKFDIVDAKTAKEAEAFNSTLELVVHAISD